LFKTFFEKSILFSFKELSFLSRASFGNSFLLNNFDFLFFKFLAFHFFWFTNKQKFKIKTKYKKRQNFF